MDRELIPVVIFFGILILLLPFMIYAQMQLNRVRKATKTRAGRALKRCLVCSHEIFHDVISNGYTIIIDQDNGLRHSATAKQCQRCGYLHWFADVKRPKD